MLFSFPCLVPHLCCGGCGVVLVQVKWKNLHFIMWDIGGQESLRQAWSTYYTGTHILLLVVDSTDRARLTVAKEELYKMLGHDVSHEVYQTSLSSAPEDNWGDYLS